MPLLLCFGFTVTFTGLLYLKVFEISTSRSTWTPWSCFLALMPYVGSFKVPYNILTWNRTQEIKITSILEVGRGQFLQPQDVDRFFQTCCNPVKAIMESFCFYDCDLCNAEYVGNKSRHLHQRIDEYHHAAIGRHLKNVHRLKTIGDLGSNFSVLKRCNGKLDCLIGKMLFVKEKKPRLNTQSDSTRAKLFF